MPSPLYHLDEQSGPLILNFPHSGTYLPDDIAAQLNPLGRLVPDTDWHVPKLYGFAKGQVTWMEATHSRYVVDLNRDPKGGALYAGKAGTELCPTTDFLGEEIYEAGNAPDAAARSGQYFTPYHQMLGNQLQRIYALNGFSILLDCHSIKGQVPRLFEGQLPTLNLGTFNGQSCDPELAELAAAALNDTGFSFVLNGRFTGGWITRNYGIPKRSIYALQLEIAQCSYMDEDNPTLFCPDRAKKLQHGLKDFIAALHDWAANEERHAL